MSCAGDMAYVAKVLSPAEKEAKRQRKLEQMRRYRQANPERLRASNQKLNQKRVAQRAADRMRRETEAQRDRLVAADSRARALRQQKAAELLTGLSGYRPAHLLDQPRIDPEYFDLRTTRVVRIMNLMGAG